VTTIQSKDFEQCFPIVLFVFFVCLFVCLFFFKMNLLITFFLIIILRASKKGLRHKGQHTLLSANECLPKQVFFPRSPLTPIEENVVSIFLEPLSQ